MNKLVMTRSSLLCLLCFCVWQVQSQTPVSLPVPTNLKATYTKGTRNIDGRPGAKYWQNGADYTIKINFDPATRLVSGTETIVYTNSSPDTLKEILFKLYPNLYKKGSPRMMKISDKDATDGMLLEQMSIDDQPQDINKLRIDATNMTVRIKPLQPGHQLRFNIQFSYTLNAGSHIRTGQVDSGAFFLAYFFPRIAVYDDIDGWNRNPYLGTAEFYNDFCNFNLFVTVPDHYLVWATGDLVNAKDLLAPKYYDRLQTAEKADDVIDIIDSNDVKAGGIGTQVHTWQFTANKVTDMAVGVSNHYVWQSSSLVVDSSTGRRTRVDAVFNAAHKDYYKVADDARKTVSAMSFRFPKWPYPYAHETVFDGLDQMEYPMMVNDNPLEDRSESIELTDHEIFHTMFPFYMGINETKYGWMDEGWATIGEWLISPMIDTTIVDEYGMGAVNATAGSEFDLPITTLTTQLSGTPMFINSYPKPALGYLYVKDMLGDELFYKGLHNYFRNWNGKHPMPFDFFNSMNTGSGKNLNWFWKKWFYDGGVPDLAISRVSGKQIIIESIGEKPVPIDLAISYQDGSTEKIHRSIAVWEKGNKQVTITVNSNKKIKKILMGSTYAADRDVKNNVWEGGK
ncbi:MAG: M1 family metallopeptidase [Sphingobacteriales bacterium]|nr:M1 family metallopeptidase [Sphingobacteriales bacterium]